MTAVEPWGFGNSPEWDTSCPPPRHNFTELPRIRSERAPVPCPGHGAGGGSSDNPLIEEWFDKIGDGIPTSMRDELEDLTLRLGMEGSPTGSRRTHR